MIKRSIIIITIIIILFFSFPILFILLKKDNIEYNILNQLTKKLKGENELITINKTFYFVCSNTNSKDLNQIYNGSTLNLLLFGNLYCDQQSSVLINLLEYNEISGRLIFLRGFDSVSHHTICEIKGEKSTLIADPFYRFFPKFNNNFIISDNLKNKKIRFKNLYYNKLFLKKNKAIIHRYHKNTFITNEKNRINILDFWFLVFDQFAINTYLNIIEKQNRISAKDVIKIKNWFMNDFLIQSI